MTTRTHSRQLQAGDTLGPIQYTIGDRSSDGTFTAWDITGGAVWMTAKLPSDADDDDDDAVFKQAAALTTPADGVVTITVPAASTTVAALTAAGVTAFPVDLPYDVRARRSDGRVATVERGTIRVEAPITRVMA